MAFILVVLVSIILSFVLSNYMLIHYEKNKGKRLNSSLRIVIKDAFALFVMFLLVFIL